MKFNSKQAPVIDIRTKREINARVREIIASVEAERALIAITPHDLLQRLLKVYLGLKPLFAFLSTFPILPKAWRDGIKLFASVLDALVMVAPDGTVVFKAGKDLEPAA
jgi:hypothetical protein